MRRIFQALIICCLLSSLCFAESKNIPADDEQKLFELRQKAINYAAEGNFEGAQQEYKQLSEITKTQLVNKYLKIIEDILGGKVKRDIGLHLFKGLQLSDKYEATGNEAICDEAITEFEWVVKAKPDLDLAHYLLGHTCYSSSCVHKKGFEYAVSAFEKATEIDPDFAFAHYYLALAYYFYEGPRYLDANTRCKLAVEHYDKAVSLDPSLKNMPSDPSGPSAEEFISGCRKVLEGEVPSS